MPPALHNFYPVSVLSYASDSQTGRHLAKAPEPRHERLTPAAVLRIVVA